MVVVVGEELYLILMVWNLFFVYDINQRHSSHYQVQEDIFYYDDLLFHYLNHQHLHLML
jgi:hypothetical protein